MIKKLIFFLLISPLLFAQSSGISFEKSNWQSILNKAKAEKKLVFLDAYTSWCGPCKSMTKNVFPDQQLGELYNGSFVNAKIDMEEGEGPMLAARYPLRGYPTLFFIDPNTQKVVKEILGYQTAEQLISAGKSLSTKKNNNSNKTE